MDKYLIINADDFGMCHAANAATIDLFEKGGITSATIMTPCPWAPEALRFAQTHPEYAIGVHITFTSEWRKYCWRPVSPTPCPSLRDHRGYMHFHCDDFEKNAKTADVEAEMIAQIEFARSFGFEPSHCDNHMGAIYGLEGMQCFLPTMFKVCAKYGYPFRLPIISEKTETIIGVPVTGPLESLMRAMNAVADQYNVPLLDHLWEHSWDGPQSDSYENFRDYMLERFHHCPDGIVETYIHPSIECDELANTTSVPFRRIWEHRLFGDPATRKHIEALGIQLINYRDLKKMRGQ
ncbi:MAG: polysaccharide deacetylase family protein [Clostridia bacterium]|nr:polysaccharide deacetylase family protein [Clostridia bacterium]